MHYENENLENIIFYYFLVIMYEIWLWNGCAQLWCAHLELSLCAIYRQILILYVLVIVYISTPNAWARAEINPSHWWQNKSNITSSVFRPQVSEKQTQGENWDHMINLHLLSDWGYGEEKLQRNMEIWSSKKIIKASNNQQLNTYTHTAALSAWRSCYNVLCGNRWIFTGSSSCMSLWS